MSNCVAWAKPIGLLCFFSFLVACGGQKYTTEHIQDFRFYTEEQDDEVNEALQLLTDQYNDEIGFTAISWADNPDEANSRIQFPRGLRQREQKLGLGQWITVMTEEGQDILPSSDPLKRSIYYSMELSFDFQNFKSKAENRDRPSSSDWEHLYHLFCHEVGHGLQMGHEIDKSSVMYESIPDASRPNVDYPDYFRQALKFFERSRPDLAKENSLAAQSEGRQ
jgi:hypothetical protein